MPHGILEVPIGDWDKEQIIELGNIALEIGGTFGASLGELVRDRLWTHVTNEAFQDLSDSTLNGPLMSENPHHQSTVIPPPQKRNQSYGLKTSKHKHLPWKELRERANRYSTNGVIVKWLHEAADYLESLERGRERHQTA